MRHRDDDMPLAYVAMAIEGVGLNHIDFIPMQIAAQVSYNIKPVYYIVQCDYAIT